MHIMGVLRVRYQPDKVDEAIRIYQDFVVPAVKQQPGFRSMYLVVDRASGTGMAIAIWENEAAARAFETSGILQADAAKFAAVSAGPPVREVYEVAVSA
jgi:quinol monooxygenase YgiN